MLYRYVVVCVLVVSTALTVVQCICSAAGVEKGLVILVDFPDVKPSMAREQVMRRFSKQLDAYVREMSYGNVWLAVDVTRKWHTMPEDVSHYKISSRNLEVDKSRVRKLIDDALDAVDKDVDLSGYSFVALVMAATLKDYGMIGLCGYPGMLGWSADGVLTARSGSPVKGVAIFCYQAHLGTLFHDVAHILGGVKDGKRLVPCLYDHDLQAKPGPMRETFLDSIINMGFWDPMSCHYRERRMGPPGISSWTKMRLGWLDQLKIKLVQPGEESEIVLGPLEEGSSPVLAIKLPVSATTYYLVENRQPIGFDRNLPGSGVLVMYADDNIPECRHGKAPVKLVNADPSIAHLEGAAFDIGKTDFYEDEANRVRIRLKEKIRNSYRILVNRR